MHGRLHDKVALVTGGSRGIGQAICQVFAREGASVIVNFASNAEKAETVVAAIVGAGGRAMVLQADVASRSDVDSMVTAAIKQFSRIDILINNAGIFRFGNTLQLNETDFDRLFAVNVNGVIHSVQAVT